MKHKHLQMKFTFFVVTLLLVLAFSGVVSAVADDQPSASYVVETGENFDSPYAIQDSLDDSDTSNGHHIQVQPELYFEQLTITKNLTITGMGATPQDTIILSSSEDGTIIIPSGVAVVLENLAIWNMEDGPAITNNGQLTIINCFVNGTYIENELIGFATENSQAAPGETMVTADAEPGNFENSEIETSLLLSSLATTEAQTDEPLTSGILTTENTAAGTSTQDPGIPLASLASGMLMVMGGTVISGKK